ncbi:hypothetical protein [Silvibacterium sp.]|uniref:hypothetical protein n=1 Tax=Silvibacterium sp. TaxID=1964179 RepID=UPI0039E3F707
MALGLSPLTSRDASDEVANLALALNFSQQDTTLPTLPVIAEPPLDPCTLDDIFESLDTKSTSTTTATATSNAAAQVSSPRTVVNTQKAMAVAQAKHNNGEDNETYDFYLLLKSENVQGWTLPANLKEK